MEIYGFPWNSMEVFHTGLSLHFSSHFFHLLTPPRFGALNLPEVNQFTGNCCRMVRIVLKITFLGLRYPKGVTGGVPLCPIMALDFVCCRQILITRTQRSL